MTIRLMLPMTTACCGEGLRRSMTEQGFDVVGEAGDGDEAVRLADQLRPDVVLMDVTMPEIDGVEATRQIKSTMPAIKIVMLTMHADQEVLAEAIRAGASGYLVKDCSTEEIASAVRLAVSGETALSPQLAVSNRHQVRRMDRDQVRCPRGGAHHQPPLGGGPPADRRRLLDPRGRRTPLHLTEDREEPPRLDLPEARRP